jgi:hypothetical protein
MFSVINILPFANAERSDNAHYYATFLKLHNNSHTLKIYPCFFHNGTEFAKLALSNNCIIYLSVLEKILKRTNIAFKINHLFKKE